MSLRLKKLQKQRQKILSDASLAGRTPKKEFNSIRSSIDNKLDVQYLVKENENL